MKKGSMMNKHIQRGLVLAGVLVATTSAHAAIDVTGVVTEIEGIAAPAALIGAAMLIVLAGIKAWKVVRRAM